MSWACCSLAAWHTPAEAQKKAPDGAKVFLLSGGQREHHGYRDQAFYLASTLENTGRFDVTIGEDAAILETPGHSQVRPAHRHGRPPRPRFKFTPASRRPSSSSSGRDTGMSRSMAADNAAARLAARLERHARRDLLPHRHARRQGPTGDLHVKIVDTSSPITHGLKDFQLKDELYYNMQMMPDVQPLATIEYQGVAWPVAWTRTFGKGRVFHTNLGHRGFRTDQGRPAPRPQPRPPDPPGSRMGRRGPDCRSETLNPCSSTQGKERSEAL